MADSTTPFPSIRGAQPGRSRRQDLFEQTASAGLQTMGGHVFFDYGDRRLRGPQAYRIFSEMGDDSAAGVLLYLIRNIVRGLKWSVRPFDQSPEASQLADFVESCMDDLDEPWSDFVTSATVLSAQYGFAPFEQVYKLRGGVKGEDEDEASSRHDDGKIGWASFQLIGQDTIQQWEFDDHNRVTGLWQQTTPTYQRVFIAASRLLNFRNAPYKGGPTGTSIFRRAFRPYLRRKALEDIECIGLERRLCGTPVIHAPPAVLSDHADNPSAQLRDSFKKIVRDMHADDQSGILFPLAYDSEGREMFKLELLSGGDSAAVDVSKPIERYNSDIFRSSMADFLGLGQGTNSGGSYAMHSSKAELAIMGIRAQVRTTCDLLNRVAIPRLLSLNGLSLDVAPEIDHSPMEEVDTQAVCASLQSLSSAGFNVVDHDVLIRLFEVMGLPAPKEPTEMPTIPGAPGVDERDDLPEGRPVPAPAPRKPDAAQPELPKDA